MALLAIAAVIVDTRLVAFFEGRTLTVEAQRLLSLTHYARSRAVSEGLPMTLTLSPADSTYGLAIQTGFAAADPLAVNYTLDSALSLRTTPSTLSAPAYASYGTTAGSLTGGVGGGLTAKGTGSAPADGTQIRFSPDGTIDESSPGQIILQHRNGRGLQLSLNDTRLAYEILPWSTDASTR